jgi:ubiquitin-conjugating enzyme E2 Z
MSTFISKETISRLLKDVKHILKNPLTESGIYYIHDDADMMKGYALIIGPSDTPYFGGNFFFEFDYPSDYPHSPPKVKYCTNGNNIRFNPNLYVNGKVCVSLLNTWHGEQWTSCQSITTILLTLCTLLCEDPLLNEPGVAKGHKDMKNYTEIINYSNLNVAVCDIVSKKNSVVLPFFEMFYSFVKENFNKNYDKLLAFAEKKYTEEYKESVALTTGFYNMNVQIDYAFVINKLKQAKAIIEIM